jgi:triosephosphate isomerase
MALNKKPCLAGNWKMHKLEHELTPYLEEFQQNCSVPLEQLTEKIELMLAVPHVLLAKAQEAFCPNHINIAAQNFHWEAKGAFTGEVSACMLKDMGLTHSLVGHSERRLLFGEKNEDVKKKIQAATELGITSILCVGEERDQREMGQTYEVVEKQLSSALEGASELQGLIIAYEPVWAIGTGLTASPQEAQEVHAFIRGVLHQHYGKDSALEARILYGGSMNTKVIKDLVMMKDIDGGLVGSASLDAASFAKMASIFYDCLA